MFSRQEGKEKGRIAFNKKEKKKISLVDVEQI